MQNHNTRKVNCMFLIINALVAFEVTKKLLAELKH